MHSRDRESGSYIAVDYLYFMLRRKLDVNKESCLDRGKTRNTLASQLIEIYKNII